MEAEDKQPTFSSIPPNFAWVAGGIALGIFFVCDFRGYPEEGRMLAFTVGALLFACAQCTPIWHTRWFWPVLLSIAVLHVWVIFTNRWPEMHFPTILIGPFAFIDFLAIIGLMKLMHVLVGAYTKGKRP